MNDTNETQAAPVASAVPTAAEAMAELKNKLAAVQKAREDRELARKNDPAVQIPLLQRELADASALASAEAEHGLESEGMIATVKTRLGLVILKRPNALKYRQFQDSNKKATSISIDNDLVRPCLVYPDAARWDVIINELPDTIRLCGDKVVELAGFQSNDLSGK